MKERILSYVKAGYPCLYIVSNEEERVQALLNEVALAIEYSFFAWDCDRGILNVATGDIMNSLDPVDALKKFIAMPGSSMFLLQDFHLYLEKPIPKMLRSMKDAMAHAKMEGKTLIVLGCRKCLPPELEKLITVIDFKLPDRSAMEHIVTQLTGMMDEANRPQFNMVDVTQALQGMTTLEAENALSLAYTSGHGFDPIVLSREKVRMIERSGLLTYEEEGRTMADVGGLSAVKDYTQSLNGCYSPEAVAFGLPFPKGVFLSGISGCGKSLITKIMAKIMGLPLLALDIGRLFGSKVGETEERTREFIDLCEAIAPVYVRIDEIEKGFSGMGGGGKSDGGTADRSFASLLKWMEERTSSVYIAATANKIEALPPEFLRRGRWDELFFVDLPTEVERLDIWHIHIAKLGRDPSEYKLDQLVKLSEGYTGAEIEQAAKNALRLAFHTEEKKLTNGLLAHSAKMVIPLSSTMEQEIDRMRDWAKGRALNAGGHMPTIAPKGRKLKPF